MWQRLYRKKGLKGLGAGCIHSIVRDGHGADCEAQPQGCRVMGVMGVGCR